VRPLCVLRRQKDLTVLGIGGERIEHYAPSLRLLAHHRRRIPFERAITHRVPLAGAAAGLELSQTGAAMKVLVAPGDG
jgi:threonine dehydrogenase-like Zn-dependent dehydrogenase